MSADLPYPKFKFGERVVVVGDEAGCEQFKGERGTVVWMNSYYLRRPPIQPDRWLYILHLPAQSVWKTFFQSDLESDGSFEPESVHLGVRPEISFDIVLEAENDWAEGSYRLPGEDWQVVIFRKDDVAEIQWQSTKWKRLTNGERDASGVVIRFPQQATLSREELIGAMSRVFGYETWDEVRGPDSIVLR